MCRFFRLRQIKLGTAYYNVLLMAQIMLKHLLKVKGLRLAVDKRQHIYGDSVLHLCHFVQIVKHYLRISVLFKVNYHSHTLFTVGLVTDIAYALYPLGLDQVHHACQHNGTVYLIGHLRNHDARSAVFFFKMSGGTHLCSASARHIRLVDAGNTVKRARGGEIRPLYKLHKVGNRTVGVIYQMIKCIYYLTHIVGRDIGSHTNRNTYRAVNQKVWETARKHLRLFKSVIEVG